jgi:hypothetical protein
MTLPAPRIRLGAAVASKPRALRFVLVISFLPLTACNATSAWLSGTDQDSYTWEPALGTRVGPVGKDLSACESGGPSSSAVAANGAPAIQRSENSPAVAECMAAKGYQKLYQSRTTML